MSDPIHVISLGAGVQSSTMALMAAAGELTPMPVAAIFADTQAEPASVYRWLDWLEKQLPFPVYRVTAGSLPSESTRLRHKRDGSGSYVRNNIPAYVRNEQGRASTLMRGCTRDFKIIPVVRRIRQLMRETGAASVVQWFGISRDEAHRVKPPTEKGFTGHWPLVDAGIRRADCFRWMEARGFPRPPRSACTFCPYHSDAEWHRLKTEEPADFEAAVTFEAQLQAAVAASSAPSARGGALFLHRSLRPLDSIDFTPDDRQADMFGNECEGMCGV